MSTFKNILLRLTTHVDTEKLTRVDIGATTAKSLAVAAGMTAEDQKKAGRFSLSLRRGIVKHIAAKELAADVITFKKQSETMGYTPPRLLELMREVIRIEDTVEDE